jgi:hypothetical protein
MRDGRPDDFRQTPMHEGEHDRCLAASSKRGTAPQQVENKTSKTSRVGGVDRAEERDRAMAMALQPDQAAQRAGLLATGTGKQRRALDG